jgi:unsaturated rhamnogalacturonyl hydrolase
MCPMIIESSRQILQALKKHFARELQYLCSSTTPLAWMPLLICVALSSAASAQQSKDKGEFSRYVGDAPSRALPKASDLTPALSAKAVSGVLRKVADWQLDRSRTHFDQDWTFAVLYAGMMAVPDEVAGKKYSAAMKLMGDSFHWQLGENEFDANDQAITQTYLELYKLNHDAVMMQPTKEQMDKMLNHPDPTAHLLWWWCDALFMAPPALAELSQVTGQQKYLDYMDRQWWATSAQLYDPKEHLFFRDARFVNRHEANGNPVFWSRGNGWVMAGLVRVLKAIPKDYPTRSKYVQQLQEMAESIIKVQGTDGLWRSGLLDAEAYQMPETSGTALITYALAYGVNENILDRRQVEPHVQRAWVGLVDHIYADGRLGAVQRVGDSPGKLKPTSSYVYGVGAFLLAGSEIYRMTGE